MICIYHSRDLDGFTSGAIVKLKYPDATIIGYDYGEPFPWDLIPDMSEVIMVDVSLPMDDMLRLAMQCEQFTWIDHHISAITEYKSREWPPHMLAVLANGISACEGTWNYLFPNKPMPEAVLLLGEYDTWRNQDEYRWNNAILPFQFGMRMICSSPETFPERLFHLNTYDDMIQLQEIVNEGKVVLRYQAEVNATMCKKASFEFNFKGLRAVCLNGGGFNSDVFKSVYDEKKHDIMMPFQFNGKFWVFSMYTTKDNVDCLSIAKEMKGGGHARACGFLVNNLQEVFGG